MIIYVVAIGIGWLLVAAVLTFLLGRVIGYAADRYPPIAAEGTRKVLAGHEDVASDPGSLSSAKFRLISEGPSAPHPSAKVSGAVGPLDEGILARWHRSDSLY